MNEEAELHFSYFFLPFRYGGEDLDFFKEKLDPAVWQPHPHILKEEGNRESIEEAEQYYTGWGTSFFAHVNDHAAESCFYYTLKPESFGRLASSVMLPVEAGFLTTPYRISEVSLVCFRSMIGFVILKYLDQNPAANEYSVAEMCAYMSHPEDICVGEMDAGESVMLMTCIRALFDREIVGKMKFQFQHSKLTDGRLNFLSFNYSYETPGKFTTDNKQLNRMYMARYGYSGGQHKHPAGYEYDDYAEILALDDYINFGMTPAGLACLAYGCMDRAGEGHREYLTGLFLRRFQTEILFLYILILHQKQLLLAGLRSKTKDAASEMFHKVYQHKQISEDVLIQRIYSKTYRQMAIDELAEDLDRKTEAGIVSGRAHSASGSAAGGGKTPALLTAILIFSAVTALSSAINFMWYINQDDRSVLWIVIALCIFIFMFGLLFVTYARDSMVAAMDELLDDRKSYKYIIVIGLIFIILMIFVARWAAWTGS